MNGLDRRNASFAEAEGKFPSILNWGELDPRIRANLWNAIYPFLQMNLAAGSYKQPLLSIMRREFAERQHRFLNEFERHVLFHTPWDEWENKFKRQDYVEIFDFITFLIRDPDFPTEMTAKIAAALDKPFCPYRLSMEAKTIFPAIGENETTLLKNNLKVAFNSQFTGSKTHLQTALHLLGEGDYRATIRESIHAVESAVKDFTDDPAAIVSKATKKLVSEFAVHKALAEAFDKLYAYANDEKGIRHALVFKDNEKVGLDEAAFFLSACTAFVGFLSRKKLKIETTS